MIDTSVWCLYEWKNQKPNYWAEHIRHVTHVRKEIFTLAPRWWLLIKLMNSLYLPHVTFDTSDPHSSATTRGWCSSLNDLWPSWPEPPDPNVNTVPPWNINHYTFCPVCCMLNIMNWIYKILQNNTFDKVAVCSPPHEMDTVFFRFRLFTTVGTCLSVVEKRVNSSLPNTSYSHCKKKSVVFTK